MKNRYKSDKKKPGQAGSSRKEEEWCSFHKTFSHNTSECYTVKKKEADEHKRTEAPHPPKHNKTKQYPRIYKNLDAESDSEESSDDEMKFVDLVDKEVPRLTVADVRDRFDMLIGQHGSPKAQLGANANVVEPPIFEHVLVMLQNKKVFSLHEISRVW
ncbi:Gag-pol fusion protein [Phytophthora cinnamomi]|uniref:Gag-pol fusion protein n=1 Tax=Phytophthora cinnamomi TaxID=4785 RepID=UPI003559D88A|nr:Gag-pol fusion protein [Phytophthora cinnamomi]